MYQYDHFHNEEGSDEPIEQTLLEKELSLLNYTQNSNIETKSKSFMLLKALNDFAAKYESDAKNFLLNQKFLLSFNELIQIMRDSIDTQRKIEEIKKSNDEEFARNLTQNFINNLSYNIFCYDKISNDCLEMLNESNNKIFNKNHYNNKSDLSSKNYNSNISNSYCHRKNSSNFNNSIYTHTTDSTKRKNNIETKKCKDSFPKNREKKNEEKNNFKKNISKEKSCVLKKNNENNEYNRSVEKRKTCSKITITEPNKNFNNSITNRKGGSSVGKRKKDSKKSGGVSPSNMIDNSTLIIGTDRKKIGKKYSDIYLACETLNLNNSILAKRSKLMKKNDNLNNSSCLLAGRNKKKLDRFGSVDLEGVDTERDFKYKNRRSCEREGVKTKILNKVPKPSILAKQLLMNGRKCINDFNGYTEYNF